ncbi:MAG TPA: hypothetical protein DIS94_11845 [Bacteroidetes bacterium]|nr:hypothetical protein [Bacteroidota bacterium]
MNLKNNILFSLILMIFNLILNNVNSQTWIENSITTFFEDIFIYDLVITEESLFILSDEELFRVNKHSNKIDTVFQTTENFNKLFLFNDELLIYNQFDTNIIGIDINSLKTINYQIGNVERGEIFKLVTLNNEIYALISYKKKIEKLNDQIIDDLNDFKKFSLVKLKNKETVKDFGELNILDIITFKNRFLVIYKSDKKLYINCLDLDNHSKVYEIHSDFSRFNIYTNAIDDRIYILTNPFELLVIHNFKLIENINLPFKLNLDFNFSFDDKNLIIPSKEKLIIVDSKNYSNKIIQSQSRINCLSGFDKVVYDPETKNVYILYGGIFHIKENCKYGFSLFNFKNE